MALPGMDAISPGMPPGGAPPMGGPEGMPPGGPPTDPMAQQALSALDGVGNKSPNPTVAMKKTLEALDLAHKLVQVTIPQISQWQPKVAKDLHTIGRQILQTKLELQKEMPPQPPPNMMAGGPGAGTAGMPPGGGMMGGGPSSQGGMY